MNILNSISIKAKTYALAGLSVLVALIVSLVSLSALNIVESGFIELARANDIQKNTFRTILEEKNFLLNSNGSITNHKNAEIAFVSAEKSLESIYATLEELDKNGKNNKGTRSTSAIKSAIYEYDTLYKRGVYLLKKLEEESDILQKEGENITRQIQEYVESKRVEVKKKMSQKTIEKINVGSNVWQGVYMTRADEKRYLLSPDTLMYEQFKKDFAFMMREHKRLKTMSDQSFEHEKLKMFLNSANTYEKTMHDWVRHNKEHVNSVLPRTKELGESVIAQTKSFSDNVSKDMYSSQENLLIILLSVTAVSIALAVFFGSLISNSISTGLLNFQVGLLDFFKYLDRQKNSVSKIEINSKDEISVMAEVINENIIKIEEVMEQKLIQIQKSDEQMKKQSRLAQMGEMVSMIAHQWRQPLGAISSTVADIEIKLLHRRMYDLSKPNGRKDMEIYMKERLEEITGLTKHLSVTIEDFRNFFKPDKEKSQFLLSQLMDRTLSLSHHLTQVKGVEIIREYKEQEELSNYANEITQVMLNIIHNAVEALDKSATDKPKIIISISKNKMDHQTVSIEDNAGGIDKEIIEKIFDPYFSTKGTNGTGLGLYMSKMIIHEHCNGLITVKNTDKGAKFTLEFLDEKEINA